MNLPNLKDAKVRTKNQVNIKYGEYDIPENMENIGHGKYYYILTYEEFTYHNANGWTWNTNIRYV